MRTIRVMLASSEELHDEKLALVDLMAHLNEVFAKRGIRLKPVKWDLASGQGPVQFMDSLKDCELCLNLYWRELPQGAAGQLDAAYTELKEGRNPRNLYVFFKEPEAGLADELRDFKAGFVTNYGHFFCRFENVDTMNLHFVMELEAYRNELDDRLLEVSDGKMVVDGQQVADLSNVPFAANNQEFQRLRSELSAIDAQVADCQQKFATAPTDPVLLAQLVDLSKQREKKAQELDRYAGYLYNIALDMVRHSGQRISERLSQAWALFEKGDVEAADKLLDLKIMKREDDEDARLFEETRKARLQKIDEYWTKARIVVANASLTADERFEIANEAYERALEIALKEQRMSSGDRLARLVFDYALLCDDFGRHDRSIRANRMAYNMLKDSDRKFQFALTLNNLGAAYDHDGQTAEAELALQEGRVAFESISGRNDVDYLKKYSRLLYNLGIVKSKLGKPDESMALYQKALPIRQELAKTGEEKRVRELAETYCNLASLYQERNEFKLAGDAAKKALDCYSRLAATDPEQYEPEAENVRKAIAYYEDMLQREGV